MPHGIMIFGGSGSGKTTLGRKTAEKLGWPLLKLNGADSVEENAQNIIRELKK